MDIKGKRVAIIATDLFEEAELYEPKQALEEAGAEVAVIAPHDGEIQAVQHIEKTRKIPVDLTLAQANPDDFDAVLLPGGAMNADALRVERSAQEFVRHLDTTGKPVAVICHGPWLLISARIIKGRRLTSYHTIADDLANAGAEWVDQEVITDKNWVSSRKPADIPAFNKAFIALLSSATGE